MESRWKLLNLDNDSYVKIAEALLRLKLFDLYHLRNGYSIGLDYGTYAKIVVFVKTGCHEGLTILVVGNK